MTVADAREHEVLPPDEPKLPPNVHVVTAVRRHGCVGRAPPTIHIIVSRRPKNTTLRSAGRTTLRQRVACRGNPAYFPLGVAASAN